MIIDEVTEFIKFNKVVRYFVNKNISVIYVNNNLDYIHYVKVPVKQFSSIQVISKMKTLEDVSHKKTLSVNKNSTFKIGSYDLETCIMDGLNVVIPARSCVFKSSLDKQRYKRVEFNYDNVEINKVSISDYVNDDHKRL